jgi:hypothetical protein
MTNRQDCSAIRIPESGFEPQITPMSPITETESGTESLESAKTVAGEPNPQSGIDG